MVVEESATRFLSDLLAPSVCVRTPPSMAGLKVASQSLQMGKSSKRKTRGERATISSPI